ncbi:hypothetical protein CEE45_17220 [Candidatus Heimdallarchaeota archaeon B3_Heim]|nr:MAG: hypothetical protein CEE45_17220 [Candidatus Heimdallarchaeota archaeon B3_Heim]
MKWREKFSVRSNPEVYPPSEDTWFLTEFLSDFLSRYKIEKGQSGLICEVGIGTGYILIYLYQAYPYLRFFGTDISPMAVSLSIENIKEWIPDNNAYFCCARYLDCFNPQNFSPDIIYFNPPYVRTSFDEYIQTNSPIVRTWAGGPSGVIPVTKFLDGLHRFKFKYAFFLSSSLNDNSDIMRYTQFHIVEMARKKIEGEQLICYQATPRS